MDSGSIYQRKETQFAEPVTHFASHVLAFRRAKCASRILFWLMVFANVKFLRDLDWTKVHLKTVLHADRTVFHAIREDAQYALRDF